MDPAGEKNYQLHKHTLNHLKVMIILPIYGPDTIPWCIHYNRLVDVTSIQWKRSQRLIIYLCNF